MNEEELDGSMRRTGFGRDGGPDVRERLCGHAEKQRNATADWTPLYKISARNGVEHLRVL